MGQTMVKVTDIISLTTCSSVCSIASSLSFFRAHAACHVLVAEALKGLLQR
jgi:hypothetical protein